MPNYRLLTPGPTQLPEDARLAMARSIRHHRTGPFRELVGKVLDGLKYVFQTRNDVLLITGSGTGAMEAAVASVVPRGGKAIVLESGKFSERWRLICEAFGINVIRHEIPWGEAFSPDDVARLLADHPDTVAIYTTLSESSTGVAHDIEAIGRVVSATPSLLVVDAVSGAGAIQCRTDAWGIDLLVVGAQKALMGPPGLSCVAVSPKAWSKIETVDRQAFYFDLTAYRKALAESDTPYTPAIPLVAALAQSLREIRAQGIESIWSRARLLARATRAGIEALGMRLSAARPADSLTAAFFPEGIDGKAFLTRLETRFGVKLAGGQGRWKGKILRIAHFGTIDELDILSALAAMELVLVEMGRSVKLGSGVAAASEVLARGLQADRSVETICPVGLPTTDL
jgi:aspartate aminotransferase-like enzyme